MPSRHPPDPLYKKDLRGLPGTGSSGAMGWIRPN